MAIFEDPKCPTQTSSEERTTPHAHDQLNLFSFGSDAHGWRRVFRNVVMGSLMAITGCRPIASENAAHLDHSEHQRGVATAPLDPGAAVIGDEPREGANLQGYDSSWNALVDRYEPILIAQVHDRIVLDSMMLTEAQVADVLKDYPAEHYPNQEMRIQLLADSAITKGYASPDVAEHAHHTYLYIKARALCTDMLEVQFSGFQPGLAERTPPTVSATTPHTDDPIHDALRLLTSMSEVILLSANKQGANAERAAADTHPGTVMARDLSRMLVEPQSIGTSTRSDLEEMANVTLKVYREVANDTALTATFNETLKHALDVVLARRAGLFAEGLHHNETEILAHTRQPHVLVHFDSNGDGIVSKSELAPLSKRYGTELVSALQGLSVPTTMRHNDHEGEH